jgi:hypothetical protein
LSSLDVLETDSILVRLPFRLGPADIGYPLSEKSHCSEKAVDVGRRRTVVVFGEKPVFVVVGGRT